MRGARQKGFKTSYPIFIDHTLNQPHDFSLCPIVLVRYTRQPKYGLNAPSERYKFKGGRRNKRIDVTCIYASTHRCIKTARYRVYTMETSTRDRKETLSVDTDITLFIIGCSEERLTTAPATLLGGEAPSSRAKIISEPGQRRG